MGYGSEAVDSGGFKGTVDKERVVVTDECLNFISNKVLEERGKEDKPKEITPMA